MFRLRVIAPLLVVGLLSGSYLMGEDKKTDKEPIIVNARLPQYYKQLALSKKQRDDILRIRAKCAAEIEKLNEQIAALKTQEKLDMENVLTPAQKARLKELMSGKDKEKATEVDKQKATEIDKPTEAKKK